MRIMFPDLIIAGGVALAASIPLTKCSEAHGAESVNSGSALMALVGMPPEWSDRSETNEARIERLRPWAFAIENASSGNQDTAALLALVNHESMVAKRIQFDQCRANECDAGKARGLAQIQRNACKQASAIWSSAPDGERFKLEAECALDVFWAAQEKCKGSNGNTMIDGFSGYRGKCKTSDGKLRHNTYITMLDVLENGWPRPPSGWQRDPKPSLQDRRYALQRIKELDAEPGDFFKLPSGAGVLVEWHFHDFGGDVSPRGWHKGLSLYFWE